MFDIAFSEILVIAVVALVVLGPEKLPKTARTLGHLYGRLRRYVSEVQADITREMELDELRKLRQQVQSTAREIETSMTSAVRDVESNVRTLEAELNESAGLGAADSTAAPPEILSSPPAISASEPLAMPGTEPSAPVVAPLPGEAPPKQASLPGLERP